MNLNNRIENNFMTEKILEVLKMKYEFFWESDSPFSQWYKAEFIVKELEFFLKGKSEKKEFVEIFSKNERIIEISELITKDGLKFNCCEQFIEKFRENFLK